MTTETKSPIFPDNKRVRLGIWGLGRGMSFFHLCEALGLDVVAGCDYNRHMREEFLHGLRREAVADHEEQRRAGDQPDV